MSSCHAVATPPAKPVTTGDFSRAAARDTECQRSPSRPTDRLESVHTKAGRRRLRRPGPGTEGRAFGATGTLAARLSRSGGPFGADDRREPIWQPQW